MGEKRKEAVNEAQRGFLKEREIEIGGKKIENAKVEVEWVILNVFSRAKEEGTLLGIR